MVEEMKGRILPIAVDEMESWPSEALNAALDDFLSSPPNIDKQPLDRDDVSERDNNRGTPFSDIRSREVMSRRAGHALAIGYHLLHFLPVTQETQLLEDGTDVLHAPDRSWKYRLWMGGSLKITKPPQNGRPAQPRLALVERISNVKARGSKVLVEIERVILRADLDDADLVWKTTALARPLPFQKARAQLQQILSFSDGGFEGQKQRATRLRSQAFPGIYPRDPASTASVDARHYIRETRWLCFMRDKPDLAKPRRIVPPETPNIIRRVTFTPTPALLARFSALTYNAHAIHLDPSYTKEHYGLRERLVHGPLTLILMLRVATRAIIADKSAWWNVEHVDYKNHAPLYVNEELSIVCTRVERSEGPDGEVTGTMEVWIERQHEDGGPTVCVSGKIKLVEPDQKAQSDDQVEEVPFGSFEGPGLVDV